MTKIKNKKGGQDLIQNNRNKISNILQVSDNQNITKLFNILNKLKYSDQIKAKITIINNIKRIINELYLDNKSKKPKFSNQQIEDIKRVNPDINTNCFILYFVFFFK